MPKAADGSRLGSIPACAGEPRPPPSPPPSPPPPRRVYPRVCGGTSGKTRVHRASSGLSPRVRGNPEGPACLRSSRRSIPACAGEPGEVNADGEPHGVYPRVCGGTRVRATNAAGGGGLSPRVRGNRRPALTPAKGRRSIPACAGEPPWQKGCPSPRKVYPRVCGGTAPELRGPRRDPGLSPRVRGNPRSLRLAPYRRGSIPACAGEPPAPPGWPGSYRVYPRVCGGIWRGGRWEGGVKGLSPRVRGNRRGSPRSSPWRGSIPACAGEPVCCRILEQVQQVYPRVCGGTVTHPSSTSPPTGLSPRVRGNRRHAARHTGSRGSIPACAGEPARRQRARMWCEVYPRVCGGTGTNNDPSFVQRGLSPRVRGNQTPITPVVDITRSIPACAGEPARCTASRPSPWVYPRVCGGTSPRS